MDNMKVLLLGEFSGLYKYLYDGLKEIGVDVIWASNGDGWKKIGGADIRVLPTARTFSEKIVNYI